MKNYYFLIFALLFFFHQDAFAEIKIKKIIDKKALIEFEESDSVTEGQEFFSVDTSGKKKSLLKVTKIKNNQAVTNILKGKAEVGQSIVSKQSPNQNKDTAASEDTASTEDSHVTLIQKNHWGIMGGYLMNSMNVSFSVGTGASKRDVSASMSGSGLSLLAFYDYKIMPSLFFRITGGLDQFIASTSISTADCSSSTNCNVSINYLSGYGHLKYTFGNSKWTPWVGAGVGFLFPVSKSSSIFASSDLGMNYVYSATLGIDYKINRKNLMPIYFEYALFPTSSTVSASFMALRLGWAW